MALQAHLNELKTKHETLDNKIQAILKTPAPDNVKLSNLKKRKLFLKEQIQNLS